MQDPRHRLVCRTQSLCGPWGSGAGTGRCSYREEGRKVPYILPIKAEGRGGRGAWGGELLPEVCRGRGQAERPCAGDRSPRSGMGMERAGAEGGGWKPNTSLPSSRGPGGGMWGARIVVQGESEYLHLLRSTPGILGVTLGRRCSPKPACTRASDTGPRCQGTEASG